MGRVGQHYMTPGERQQLEALRRAGHSVRDIACQLGCCRQTIYNELRRGAVQVVRYVNGIQRDVVEYSAQAADQRHAYAQSNKGRELKIGNHHDYARRLEDLMRGVQADGTVDRRKRYSPAAALAQARREGYAVTVCPATLYSYIAKGVFLHLTRRDLWAPRKKRRYHKVQRVAHPLLPSIEQRPLAVHERAEPGHWEMDLVVGKKGQGKAALLTLTERQSRREVIVRLPDKTSASVLQALAQVQEPIRSITTDNGPEFLAYDQIRRVLGGAEVYYCHSYASWEKGTNERHNRMIRQWYPKGTDFSQVTQEDLDNLADWMNHYPRRVLGWRSPAEVAMDAQT